jgi:hypothetical protein
LQDVINAFCHPEVISKVKDKILTQVWLNAMNCCYGFLLHSRLFFFQTRCVTYMETV